MPLIAWRHRFSPSAERTAKDPFPYHLRSCAKWGDLTAVNYPLSRYGVRSSKIYSTPLLLTFSSSPSATTMVLGSTESSRFWSDFSLGTVISTLSTCRLIFQASCIVPLNKHCSCARNQGALDRSRPPKSLRTCTVGDEPARAIPATDN